MANQEHLDILEKGVEVWNQWRREHLDVKPNLKAASITRTNLSNVDLEDADLSWINLRESKIKFANLRRANLAFALVEGADFTETNFTEADLHSANFMGTLLDRADFTHTTISYTVFGDVDLSTVNGLETVKHRNFSVIGIDTIYLSKGNIPDVFLKGAGVDDTFITYIRSLVGKPIDYYSCFISYSSKDEAFAKRLHADLQSHNVRCWFAPEDLKIGDKFWHRIDESIKMYDKLLVVLSQHSVESEWVEREVMSALEKEKQQKKLVLFPVTVDEAFKQTDAPWAADIRRSRHVGDFRNWKSHDEYQKALDRLLRDLKAEAQGMAPQDGTTKSEQT